MKLRRIIRLKMFGDDVRFMQIKLKEFGLFKDKIDGNYEQNTLVSVTSFQKLIGMRPDGIVDPSTWSQIMNYDPNPKATIVIDNIPLNVSHFGENNFKIYDNLILDNDYIKEETKKETIWLYNTCGGSRPDWSIGSWKSEFQKDGDGNIIMDENIPRSLKVASSFVIGRRSSTGDSMWDGKVLKSFDDKYWAYHLNLQSRNIDINSKSIGIELCNYGPLIRKSDGSFFNCVNKIMNEKEVVELDNEFRGYKYWEKYTDLQIESLRNLIKYLQSKWDINIEKGIYNLDWFQYNNKWISNGGLRSHTQTRSDNSELFPQKELIQMLNSL